MSLYQLEHGMETQISVLEIMEKMIVQEEILINSGEHAPIENLPLLMEYVEMQKLASIALKEVMERNLPRLKADEESRAKAKKKAVAKKKLAAPPEAAKAQEIENSMSLF